ncbi:MAG: glucose-1-phosphate adenylyltransferase [Deltaproteobacteria bacterium]|nr:glucose-1-phosphate adenylyltransferase [Deltaproteobacteria bacterium]MBW1952230.1 glucose-1-phosphate adenylyltransferase [Deltaproteobacteria bacterium]MBW1985829.1 glucose-1-phosphate adenylyltransferase [Deltaproteobacteria bacterium]MBW2133853.1 glucose-1-phosphate adenylyltransferase [Deltaproteobacteria bacterium]
MQKLQHLTTLIMAGGRGERLYPLTRDKAKPAITFGGIYKIIDFTLSNCINSGIRRIYVLTQYGSLSLDQHLTLGWHILQPEMGEFIRSVPPQQVMVNRWYRGTADSIYQNINILQEERPRWTLILSGDHVYKMDYLEMLNFHLEKDAELTAGCVKIPRYEGSAFGIIHMDEEQRIIDFLEKPQDPPCIPGDPEHALGSMGVYIFNTEKLVQEVIQDARQPDSAHDFGKNIIPSMIGRERVYAYNFRAQDKDAACYWRDIGRIDAYFEANMDLVALDLRFNLYDPEWPIRTYQRQTPPAKINSASDPGNLRPAIVEDSLLSGGCIISGATVRRSVLSPNVHIDRYAEVSESIIWDDVHIGSRARIHRAIIEEGVRVPAGFTIGIDHEVDARRFPISDGGVVVVPNNVILDE